MPVCDMGQALPKEYVVSSNSGNVYLDSLIEELILLMREVVHVTAKES